ncbi:MAG: enoyl-CoA hydratase/isomerase family protein [Chloroflexi bacterium]|nr:enoyl-CoA hydratase/isomerase family protein [Chloroflexota bacterium]
MAYEFIETRQDGGVLVITLNDAKTRNALGSQMAEEIKEELDRFENDPEGRVLVLTGKDPAFCSGANVRSFANRIGENEKTKAAAKPAGPKPWALIDASYTPAALEGLGARAVVLRLHKLQKPSIAAVNGAAYGLGCGLALSCDIRIASESARFSEAFVRNGLIPADGSCWQLPRMIGLSNTLLLQYTGDPVTGEEAVKMGLASKVVAHGELMNETLQLAQKLAHGPTFSMALIKYLVMHSLNISLEESMTIAGPAQELARQTEDHKEGVTAFLEKRTPQFKGR